MFFYVTHTTEYAYSQQVYLEPLTIRLRPRADVTQRLVSFDLSVSPFFAGRSETIDLDGNAATQVWFNNQLTDRLELKTNFVVETLRSNPFDFLLSPSCVMLPVQYPPHQAAALSPYLASSGIPKRVAEFAADLARDVNRNTTAFLATLTATLNQTVKHIIRETGDPQPSQLTLSQKSGACRDVAVLFIEACRSQGLAARFVSGYHETTGEVHLHAWVEVYLVGAGWRGFDTTTGLAVADRHVAVAAGRTFREAAPTAGTFRGTNVSSTLKTKIDLLVTPEPMQAEGITFA
jgi:transglutaminase-like putative cysteine protease